MLWSKTCATFEKRLKVSSVRAILCFRTRLWFSVSANICNFDRFVHQCGERHSISEDLTSTFSIRTINMKKLGHHNNKIRAATVGFCLHFICCVTNDRCSPWSKAGGQLVMPQMDPHITTARIMQRAARFCLKGSQSAGPLQTRRITTASARSVTAAATSSVFGRFKAAAGNKHASGGLPPAAVNSAAGLASAVSTAKRGILKFTSDKFGSDPSILGWYEPFLRGAFCRRHVSFSLAPHPPASETTFLLSAST
jgi:hypothetical protein